VPWDLAQLPFADDSAAFAAILARHFAEKGVPLHPRAATPAPMRILMGAHMPAVLIEMGFLSNADDEKALGSAEWQTMLIDGVIAALTEMRRGASASAPAPATERR
jgi:N-acetylmuramoyl-L-alanine amidase